jgi:hypothetical protein
MEQHCACEETKIILSKANKKQEIMPTHVHSIEQSYKEFRSYVPGVNYYSGGRTARALGDASCALFIFTVILVFVAVAVGATVSLVLLTKVFMCRVHLTYFLNYG